MFYLKLILKIGDDKRRNYKIQFDLRQLWRLSIKFNFKVCIKQELDKLKSSKFNVKINKSIGYPDLPRFCVLCKSNNHFVKECKNMELPDLLPLDQLKLEKCIIVLDLVSEHYYKFKSVNENKELLKLIDEVKGNLNRGIQLIYPNSQLHLYGSILNGFGHAESDLDFALLFNDHQENADLNRRGVVRKIGYHQAIKKMKEIEDLQVIVNARVPIIKLKYATKSRKFECDISIENRLPFHNTLLLRTYCQIDTRVQKLGLMIKHFAKICQICFANQGGLKSYAFSIMLIHFLQQCSPPVLPILQELNANELASEYVYGWEVKYFCDLDRIVEIWPGFKQNKKSIGELFIDFFIFYTSVFNFDKDVVTIRQSARLTKFEKKWTSIIAIEDPFLLTHNLSDALEISMVNYIKTSFILARNHFSTFASKGFHHNLRIVDLFEIIFNPSILRNSSLLPFGKGCQICFKIGHKRASCPDRFTAINQQEKVADHELPMEFKLTLNDLSSQGNIQYLQLVDSFENKLRFKVK